MKLRKKSFLDKLSDGGLVAVLAIVILVVALGASWAVTSLLVYLITLCFGWEFSFLISTGVWLVLLLARWVISAAKSDKG